MRIIVGTRGRNRSPDNRHDTAVLGGTAGLVALGDGPISSVGHDVDALLCDAALHQAAAYRFSSPPRQLSIDGGGIICVPLDDDGKRGIATEPQRLCLKCRTSAATKLGAAFAEEHPVADLGLELDSGPLRHAKLHALLG